jgi:hypothetical protein
MFFNNFDQHRQVIGVQLIIVIKKSDIDAGGIFNPDISGMGPAGIGFKSYVVKTDISEEAFQFIDIEVASTVIDKDDLNRPVGLAGYTLYRPF